VRKMKSKPAARDNCGASSLSNDGAKDLQIKVSRMEKTSKRGKIPQQDWPSIIARYQGGETLSSIARSYDCSPPAISYIVSRTRARGMPAETENSPAALAAPAQLKKTAASPPATNSITEPDLMHDAATAAPRSTSTVDTNAPDPSGARRPDESEPSDRPHRAEPATAEVQRKLDFGQPATPQPGTGPHAAAPAVLAPVGSEAPAGGSARRTLHLSMSSGNGSGSGVDAPATAAQRPSNPGPDAARLDDRMVGRPPGYAHPAHEAASPFRPAVAPHGSAPPGDAPRGKAAGTFIDHALRERISGDIEAFLAAFDAALDHDTAESRSGLREATDRLLRAGARTRIELERLEARVPLGSREKDAAGPPLLRAR
jgi:transposase-like protein